MKTIILTLALLIAVSTIGLAQCGKKVVLTTSKTDHLDSSGNITRTEDEKAVIEIDKSNLTITINDDHKLSGTIKSDTCNWSVPFKNGKMVLTALITSENGEDRNVTITIEGKDGKVTLLFESKEEPGDRIRVAADKFEEAVN
jgi:predicted small lipoprotein YifL